MLKKSLAILIFVLGLAVGFSASAASGTCPTDNGAGVGCNIGIGEYYCLGACRTGQSQCPTWTGTVCATGITCPANCASADSCGYCNSCAVNYTLCGSYPSQTCTANTTAPAHCTSYNQCTATCSACANGYELLGGQCVGATLKLGPDSVGTGGYLFQSTTPSLYVLSNGIVGIGTSTPNASLEVTPASGYAILAGNYKIGNVALPTTNSDAATKGYVDSSLAYATSSIISLWGGTLGGNVWNLNSGNVGIGTTNPTTLLHVKSASGGSTLTVDNSSNTNFSSIVLGTQGATRASITVQNSSSDVQFVSSTLGGRNAGFQFLNGGSNFLQILNNGNIGIGTTTPAAKLEIIPTSGYAILAGNYRIGNVALPTATTDAATKGYVDTTIASATSSMITMPLGTSGQTLRHDGANWVANSLLYNNGTNIGIGTTNPGAALELGTTASIGNYVHVVGSSTENTYEVFRGSRRYPRFTLEDTSAGGATFSFWNLGSQMRFGTYNGTTDATAFVVYSGNRGNSKYNGDLQLGVYGNDALTISRTQNILGLRPYSGNPVAVGTLNLQASGATPTSTDNNGGTLSLSSGISTGAGSSYITFNTATAGTSGTADVNPTEKMRILGNGDVGIGTTTPNAQLEVIPASGYSILAGNFKIGNVALPTADADAATKGYVDSTVASATSTLLSLWSGTLNGNIWNGTAGAGNVGIGTTTPANTLDVNGTVRAISSLIVGNAGLASGGFSGISSIRKDADLTVGGTYRNSQLSVGSASDNGAVLIGYSSTGFGSIQSAVMGVSFSNLALQSSGGNLGIGITNPGQKLDVAGTINTSQQLLTNWGITGTGNDLAISGYSTTGFVRFLTNSAERMRILANGNVGIGTTTPNAKLEIIPTSGYAILAGNYKIGNVALPTADADAATKGYVDSTVASATSSLTSLWSGTLNGNIWNGTAGAGNVGIGISSPGAKLTVAGSILGGSDDSYFGMDTTGPRLGYTKKSGSAPKLTHSSSTNFVIARSSGNDILATNTFTDEFVINTSGNVGIGVASPTQKLDVNGNIMMEAGGNYIFYGTANTILAGRDAGAVYFGYNFGAQQIHIGSLNTGDVRIRTSGNTIIDSGKLGIGTTTPSAKLEIIPTSGYAILAGNYKIGNVALPTADADAATKGYVDSTVASATSSMAALWSGTVNGNIWNGTSGAGNVGIGNTAPASRLDITNSATSSPIISLRDVIGSVSLEIRAGTSTLNNTFIGLNAGAANSTGYQNTANGAYALYSNTTGYYNTANGLQALYSNTTGYNNTANGMYALRFNTSGYQNTANGAYALYSNTTGSQNTANGLQALYSNTTGPSNTANGMYALLLNTTGYNNTATGLQALRSNTTGYSNIANGMNALYSNTTGYQNTALGYQAGYGDGTVNMQSNIDTNSMFLGFRASRDASIATSTVLNNATAIGYNAKVAQSNSLILGGIGVNAVNVGIGTASPAAKLEIIPASGYAILAGNYKIGNVALPTADADAATKGYVDSTVASATSSLASLWGGTIGGNIWNLNSGNVGIGTTTPTNILDILSASPTVRVKVTNNSQTASIFLAALDGGARGGITSNMSTGEVRMGAIGGSGFFSTLYTNGLERMRIDTVGNVGVGTTSPGAKLDVVGTSPVTLKIDTTSAQVGETSNLLLRNNTIGWETNLSHYTGPGGINQAFHVKVGSLTSLSIGVNGLVGIGTTTPSAKLEIIPASGYAILAGNYKIGNVALPTADADAATKGYVDSTVASATSSLASLWGGTIGGNIWNLNSGNVGIGTTTPLATLHVQKSSLVIPSLNADNVLVLSNNGNVRQTLMSSNSGLGIINFGDTDAEAVGSIRYDHTFNDLWFVTNGNERLRMTGAGNIGIGTTTPVARLEVVPTSGYSILAGSYRIGNVALPTADADAATKGYVDTAIASATSSGGLPAGATGQTLRHNGTTWVANSVLFNNGTNIGIGTTTPATPLDVYGTGGYTTGIRITTNSTGGSGITVKNIDVGGHEYNFYSTGSGNSGGAGNFKIFDNTAFANRLTITGTGRIGLLTATPQSTVDILGSLSVGSYGGVNAAPANGMIVSGNVGIGTTTPVAKLEIVPTSGYAILAGNYKIGNVALPTADADAATKGYVDSTVASATSSISGLPTGATGQTLRHNGTNWIADSNLFNNGTNIGIGTTTPAYGLDIETGSLKINNNITGAGSLGTIYLGDSSFSKAFGGAFTFNSSVTSNSYFSGTRFSPTGSALSGNSMYLPAANSLGFSTNGLERLRIDATGNVGIGTTTPAAELSIAPTTGYAILAGNYKIGNVALPTADTDVVTLGFLNSALTSVSGVAKYATSTPTTYTGSQSGYSGANALCAAVQAGTHVCTTGEILNTINTGSGASIPTGTTLWISNGPPGYTANANDCIGWTSAAASDYGAVWIKLATGDGFGSLNGCSTARSFACCQ